jgi:RNA polymerase sigma factor (sigma-70 family)
MSSRRQKGTAALQFDYSSSAYRSTGHEELMATPNRDQALLREFVDARSQQAFAELVERHAGMVYSAALRQTRDRHLAEDVSQAVFLLLAERARTIGPRVVLSGWLYNSARYAGLAARRGSERRRRHEQKAADSMTSRKQPLGESVEWSEVEPAIDEAMARLREPDRVALILRYFENKSLKEVAAALRLTEDAAKRRCHRGLERLRKLLRVGAPASAIGMALSANAVQAAPAHLITAASNVPLGAPPAVSLLAKGAVNMMIQAKLKLAAVAAAFLLAIGAAQIAVTRAQAPGGAPVKTAPSAAPKKTAADLMPSQVAPGSPRAVFFEAFGAGVSGDAQKLRSLILLDPDERAIADRAVSAQLAFEKALKEAFPKADASGDGVLPGALVRFVAVQMKGMNNMVEDTAGDESTIGKPDGSFKFIFHRVNGDWKWDLKRKPKLEDDPQFRRATGEARIRLTHMLKKLAPTFEAAAKKLAAKGYASRGDAWADVRAQSLRVMQETPPELRPQTQPVALPLVAIQSDDYATVRKTFRTKLVKHGPATAPSPVPPTPADAQLIEYPSGELRLKAWLSAPPTDSSKHPAVIHLYGGLKLHPDKWANTKLFRDAGFVLMMPTLRSEHGQAGDFSAYYDEVDDVIAAADYLRSLPSVDPDRIFLVGYGDGGAVALLTAEACNKFRAVAPISAIHDYLLLSKALPPAGYKNLVFDTSNPHEFEVRSGLAYLPSLKCPAQIFYGKQEWYLAPTAERMVEVGKAHHLDVTATAVPGDSKTATLESLRQALVFFQTRL